MAAATTPILTPNRLPIEVIPGSNPPKFRWTNTVHTVGGTATQECEGLLPPTVERAVETLCGVAKQALMENAMLRGQIETLKMVNQSSPPASSRIAEAPPLSQPQPTQQQHTQHVRKRQ